LLSPKVPDMQNQEMMRWRRESPDEARKLTHGPERYQALKRRTVAVVSRCKEARMAP